MLSNVGDGIPCTFFFFFFNDTATTEIYTLSLHDALPILRARARRARRKTWTCTRACCRRRRSAASASRRGCASSSNARSEEHTSELQSRLHLVCRLLLEKKNNLARKQSIRRQRNSATVSG